MNFIFKRKYYLWVEKDADKDFKLTKMNAEMNPENKDAQISLGHSFFKRYMLDDALKKFKDLYQMYPDDHDLLDFVSRIYRTAGDFDSALHYTKQYVSLFPDESVLYKRTARLIVKSNLDMIRNYVTGFVKTQYVPIIDQLNNGIRYLEIDTWECYKTNNIYSFYGMVYTSLKIR